jgi:hypothetical protein
MKLRALLLVLVVGCAGVESVDTINGQISDDVASAGPLFATNARCGGTFSAHGRAFGLQLAALGVLNVTPTPDTDITNPGNLIQLAVSLPLGVVISLTDTVFSVADEPTTGDCSASDTATAETNALSLSLLGVNLTASTLRATASSTASPDGASVSADGLVQNLRINGKTYLDIRGPLTITVRAPLLGTPLAEVRVLETIPGNNTHDSASLEVNALHVILLSGAADVVLAHAETQAKVTTCGCGG